jgi:folate-dependent phosphoribosylglycinamide formyltransferase PurN
MALKMVWFSTARDQAALDLLKWTWQKKEEGFLQLEIPLVFVSRSYGESGPSDIFLDWVREKGIPFQTFSALGFEPDLRKKDPNSWRLAYDQEIIKIIGDRGFDWIFLAGYMWIVSPVLINRFSVLNLHPAPPGGAKGTWQEVIWETLRKKLPEAGAQIHSVTEILDEGPALTYVTFPLHTPEWETGWKELEAKIKDQGWERIQRLEGEHEPFFAKVRAKELSLEFPLIIWTFKTLESGRLQVRDRKVYGDGRWLPKGYCLNQEIFKNQNNYRKA